MTNVPTDQSASKTRHHLQKKKPRVMKLRGKLQRHSFWFFLDHANIRPHSHEFFFFVLRQGCRFLAHRQKRTVDSWNRSTAPCLRLKGQSLHPKQLQVTLQGEHPEVVRRLWFGCASYARLWSWSETDYPQTSKFKVWGVCWRHSEEKKRQGQAQVEMLWYSSVFLIRILI